MKKVYNLCHRNQVVMIGTILITTALFTVPVLAKGRITSTIDTSQTTKLTAEESQAVSVAAGRILKHVNDARVALKEEKTNSALEHIAKGLTLVQIIEQTVPPIKVEANIQAGDLKYYHEEEKHQTLIPIFDELDQVDVVGPITSVTQEKTQISDGKPTGPALVSYSGIEFTSLDLNLPLAKRNLIRAQKSLEDNKSDAADTTLRDIQNRGVLFSLIEEHLPLREVANNLKLAEYEFKYGHATDAKSSLRVASDVLKGYEKNVGEHRAKDVKKLHQEIDDLSGKLDQQQDREGVLKKMASWWDRVAKWLKS